MNTAELYVEPILIGALALALLALPFAPGIVALSVKLEAHKLPSGIALGAILIGIAYFVGFFVDRLIDSCLEALERHRRVRFALSGLKVPDGKDGNSAEDRKKVWNDRAKDDLFPEDQYRWRIFDEAEKIADSVNYVRTKIRLLRALAFLLPGLVFAGALGAVRFSWTMGCTPPKDPHSWVRPTWCDQTDWSVALPVTEASWMPFLAPCLYVLTALAALALSAWDSSRWRSRNRADNKRPWRRAGLWRPPNTRKDSEMDLYASARAWPVGDWSEKGGLWIDILAQPVFWCSILLLFAAFPAIIWLNDTLPGLVVGLLAGPLLTIVAGWAWWRTTETFMRYLNDANRWLKEGAASPGATPHTGSMP